MVNNKDGISYKTEEIIVLDLRATLQKNSQEIYVTSSALARPQPIRQGNFREIKTSLRK
jgi:hypothetical protein